MGYKVIVAEKPSVAKDIAKVVGANKYQEGYLEGNGYKVSWCIGHLIGLAPPEVYNEKYKTWSVEDLPILPDPFKTIILPSTKTQYYTLKKLLTDKETDGLICATDAAREGELIFRLVYNETGCKKPVKRLWISSMTEEAIKQGLRDMKGSEAYDNLYIGAKARQEADWIVGLNATRLFSVKHNTKLTIGRVQTPTLALIVKRYKEVNNFIPQEYFEVQGEFGLFKAIWQDNEGNRRISNPALADAIKFKCANQDGRIIKCITKEESKERPLLYDLTELQKDANQRYGMTAMEVLDTAQALYEKHKITTYPRTDSRYLSEDMVLPVQSIIHSLIKADCSVLSRFAKKIMDDGPTLDKRVFDNTKVSDHHAIIPTPIIENFDFSKLNERERQVFTLITSRLLVTLSQKHVYEITDVLLSVNTIDGIELFSTRGRKVIKNGWKEIEESIFGKLSEEQKGLEEEMQTLQDLQPLQKVHLGKTEVIKKKTEPKKYYNDKTLLSAMANASDGVEDDELKESLKDRGLGTPATRAAIIEKLIEVGYIRREKKSIIPTEKGITLINLVPEKLKEPTMTAEWEYRLNRIHKGEESNENFLADIKRFIQSVVREYQDSATDSKLVENKPSNKEIIGKCPRCGKNVYEGQKSFYCEGYKSEQKCGFSLFKNNKAFDDRGKIITAAMAKSILKDGKILVKGLKSKANNEYNALFTMKDTGQYINFDVTLAEKSVAKKMKSTY